MSNKEINKIVEPLLDWYSKNKRDLPWRHNITPYKTWISEIMLQQTRVEAVKDYFNRFLEKLPTINDLANIEEEELMKLWQGLGYYNRARNMKKMAIEVVEKYQSIIPNEYDKILNLPGIGEYTAGAILSIASQKKIPCVDGNVLRVISRVKGSKNDITKPTTKNQIKQEITQILPDQVGDFNQSLMELGALICLPNGEPKCEICPLNHLCRAFKTNQTSTIPVKTNKKDRKKEKITIFIVKYQDKLLIEQRPNKGLLASLYQLPNTKGHLTQKQTKEYWENQDYKINKIQKLTKEKHVFTHIEWDIMLYQIEVENKNNQIWATTEELENIYSLPTAFSKLLKYETKTTIITHPFEPIYNEESKILILGSFPSPKSRTTNFYYNHPQNKFWKVIAHILNEEVPITNEQKKEFLLKNKIAIWDVIHSCEIKGADDSTIKNPTPNDLEKILKNSNIKAIFTTGKKATDLYEKLIYPKIKIHTQYLPSTSPANVGNYQLEDLYKEYQIIVKHLK